MLRWAVISCLILSPLLIHCAPQPARANQYETEQDYTDAPEPVSSYHEGHHTEKSPANKAFAKPHKPAQRPHFQEQRPSGQPYQSQEQYQQYQSDYRASTQPQPTHAPAPQYEQQQHLSQAQYTQQHATHHEHRPEHRPSTTTFIPIIRLEKTQSLDGSYQQSWETGNNIIAAENGYLKHIADDQDALVQTGNYSYTAPDGTFVWNSYISDESGFRVIGSHLPTPPPIPEEIQRGLDQIYEGIRLQQEAAAREAKSGKKKPTPDEDNSVGPENDPQSDNYPPQYRYYQQKQQQPAQAQQYEQQQSQQQQVKQQYRQQPQPQYQNQEQPQKFRPIVAQPYRRVQKVQRPQSQQYQPAQHSQQFQESQRVQPDQQQQSQPEEDEQR